MSKEIVSEDIKETNFGQEKYIAPSWDQMGRICFCLAREIIAKGEKFDRLVAIAKGGWTWARTMVDYLRIQEMASVQTKHYEGVGRIYKKPIITQGLPAGFSLDGERILLFDDVNDTGRSLEIVRRYLERGGAKEVKLATLFHKPHSSLTPDYYAAVTDAWIIFPHEVRETVEQLAQRWFNHGVSLAQVRERFSKIGLNKEEVDFFLSLEVPLN